MSGDATDRSRSVTSTTQPASPTAGEAAVEVAVTGGLAELDEAALARIFDRGRADDADVAARVQSIIADVRTRGDTALAEMARRFDGVELSAIEVPAAACQAALDALEPALRDALERAAQAIETFHRAQLPQPMEIETHQGVRVGRRAEPLRRVGVYAPGGRASYPSSVLMGVIPARVAGVGEVVVCSPPSSDGLPPRAVLAACALAGADRVFALGGAGAVAAMALGTVSVPRVDKIVGPGNAYVTEAKRQLNGVVAIDCPAGPSEILVIADASAEPGLVAAELLAQAEHDPDAAAVLLTTSAPLVEATRAALAGMLATLPTAATARASLAARGALLVTATLEDAFAFSEAYAPEHLLVLTESPRQWLDRVRCAGTVFLGAGSSVAFGDYITGANHVLPTAGLARAYAGLGTSDFLRWTTYQEVSPAAARLLSAPTALLADAEGLPAHARAARLRATLPDVNAARGAAPAAPEGPRLRPAYAEIELYDPQRAPCEVDLSDNTNLFGVPAAVSERLSRLEPARVTRYPTVYATALKAALAEYHGVAPENIMTACGSDDVIDSAVRAFAEPGTRLAYPEPTFGMVPVFARMNATEPRPVPLAPGFELDADALLAERAGITYICRPNNPTGTLFERAAVERVGQEAAGVVLVDEAYADYAPDHFAAEAVGSGRMLVLRTFSKAFGLAGLRLGYALGPAALIREVEKSRGPYKVGGVAEAAGLAVLSGALAAVRSSVEETLRNRDRLVVELASLGIAVPPSAANFLLVPVAGAPAAEWARAIRGRGIGVRPFAALPQVGDSIRVSIGPWPMMTRFLEALRSTAAEFGSPME
jgi:histidinol dehydrogenase